MKPCSEKEKGLVGKLEKFFQDLKIDLAGVDFLNGMVSEINITAPTGFESMKELGDRDLAKEYMDLIVERIQ